MRRVVFACLLLALGVSAVATEVLFFYDEGCPHCKVVWDFLRRLQEQGLAFTLRTYEIHAPENWQLLYRLLAVYGAEVGPVPMVFVGDVAVVYDTFYGLGPAPVKYGGRAQELLLEEVIARAVAENAPSPSPACPLRPPRPFFSCPRRKARRFSLTNSLRLSSSRNFPP